MIIFMTHLLSNIFGLLFDPFFYTIQLMMIVFISTTANYVVKAITTHFKQLSLTMFLAILVMHSYSVLTAGHFWELHRRQPARTVRSTPLQLPLGVSALHGQPGSEKRWGYLGQHDVTRLERLGVEVHQQVLLRLDLLHAHQRHLVEHHFRYHHRHLRCDARG
jgi:hypothetical protein